jgi:sugar/nucleoside kinase (ribokinase family)
MELDICSLGNAIVDIQFSITNEYEEELNNLQITKGSMMLVEQDQQEGMIKKLNSIYGIPLMACGGSAINSMVAASCFGSNCHVSGKVSNDEHGNYFLEDLGNNNIQHSITPSQSEVTTARCLVMVSPDAERTMCTHLGISNDLSEKNIDLEAIHSAKYLFIEGYLLSSSSALDACKIAMKTAKNHGTKVAISLSAEFIAANFKKELESLFEMGCDLLVCNESEALAYSGEKDIEKAVQHLEQTSDQILITLGAEGCMGFSDQEAFLAEGLKVSAIDTNGAGDMFAGAVLHSLCEGKSLKEAAQFGCIAGSKKVESFGPRLKKEEYLEIKDNYF